MFANFVLPVEPNLLNYVLAQRLAYEVCGVANVTHV